MGIVRWRATRQPSGTSDTDLTDVRPVTDSINRFAREAEVTFSDNDGTKLDDYPRGQRVELEYSTDGGSSWTRRWAGFVQNRNERSRSRSVVLSLVGYDFFLRRETVHKTYSSESLSSIAEDLIKNFSAVNWVAANVTFVNDVTITRNFDGERVDEALDYLASQSADEQFGVNDDFEFFLSEFGTTDAPGDILQGEWVDYELPEVGEQALNKVRIWYGSGGNESFVVVEDRSAQQDLKNKLNAPSNAVIEEERTYPEISGESAAKAKGEEILSNQSPAQTGTVTSFDRHAFEPGDVFRLQIDERSIDADYVVAEARFFWVRDESVFTVSERVGDIEDRLVGLTDEVQRISARDADTTAAGTRFLQFRSGVDLSITVDVRQATDSANVFKAGYGDSGDTVSYSPMDDVGYNRSFATASKDTAKATNASLNMLRDVWQGESATDITHFGVGDDDTSATAPQNALQNEVDRVSIGRFGKRATYDVEFSASIAQTNATVNGSTIREAMAFDASSGGNGYLRATFPDQTHNGTTRTDVRFVMTVDNDADKQGVITDTGQERWRDLYVGDTGDEPTDMVYGTGTTAAAVTDTALANQIHEDAIDSTADRSTGITDIVERMGTGENNGNDIAEVGYENASDELLARITFEAISKTNNFALETNYRARASNA